MLACEVHGLAGRIAEAVEYEAAGLQVVSIVRLLACLALANLDSILVTRKHALVFAFSFTCDFAWSMATLSLQERRAIALGLIVLVWTYLAAYCMTAYCDEHSAWTRFTLITAAALGNALGSMASLLAWR